MSSSSRWMVTALVAVAVALTAVVTAMHTSSKYETAMNRVQMLEARIRESDSVIAHLKEVKIRTATRLSAAR